MVRIYGASFDHAGVGAVVVLRSAAAAGGLRGEPETLRI
jgi:hypothetical protein